jgi:DNA-binding XRE family transcriptional regulator
MVRSVPDRNDHPDPHGTGATATTIPTDDVRERWGTKLRLARVTARHSQADAGNAVGVAGPTVAKAEQGQGSVDTYDRLARHYGVTLTLGADQ